MFDYIAEQMPEYQFIKCQELNLTKSDYHSLLGRSKLVFSANLQETLGISVYEGLVVGSIPMVPDRLSYTEMWSDNFKYPSEWTTSLAAAKKNIENIKAYIRMQMSKNTDMNWLMREESKRVGNFYSGDKLANYIKDVM